jgi:hypothetical protein
MKTRRAPSKPRMISPEELARLGATPERLARARESGQSKGCVMGIEHEERLARARESGQMSERTERVRRIADPFDLMRANRILAPHDARLNDLRWMIGEALRRPHHRASLSSLRRIDLERIGATGFGPRSGLPQGEMALQARDKLRDAERIAGAAAWPILQRIVIQGGGVRDCRAFILEVTTDWRVDAILTDRLRVALGCWA